MGGNFLEMSEGTGPGEKGPIGKGPVEKGPIEKGPIEKGPVEKGPIVTRSPLLLCSSTGIYGSMHVFISSQLLVLLNAGHVIPF